MILRPVKAGRTTCDCSARRFSIPLDVPVTRRLRVTTTELTVREAHEIAERVEKAVEDSVAEVAEVLVHIGVGSHG
jgi:hypothetical protein